MNQTATRDIPTVFQPYQADETYSKRHIITDASGRIESALFYNEVNQHPVCYQTYHERLGQMCVKEQAFTNSAGEKDKVRRWYPDGWIAKEKIYTTENGQTICMEKAYNLEGSQSWEHRSIVIGGTEILDGPQKRLGSIPAYYSDEYYVMGQIHGVQVNISTKEKSYYWKDKKVPQPIWWLKENCGSLGLKDLGQMHTWKKLAKALVSKNKNPELSVNAGNMAKPPVQILLPGA